MQKHFFIRQHPRNSYQQLSFDCSRFVLILCLSICFALCGCQQQDTQTNTDNAEAYSTDLFAMDTVMTLTAYGEQAQTAVEKSAAEIERLEQIFSTNLSDSAITQLNQTKAATLPAEAVTVLQTALQLGEDTEGAFNIALYPIIKAWGFTTEQYRVPEQNELQALLPHSDIQTITLDSQTGKAQFNDASTEIDLGGIVKGYTSDCILQLMAEQGVTSAVISLGGNVQTLGTKPDGSLWRVGIQNPEQPEDCICMVEVADKAVITSGPYQRYFIGEDGLRYHHIMDPQTGAPAERGLSSVTIVCNSGILADGLSTALFVMGPEQALQYWQQHREDFDAILITDDQQIIVTAGLADCVQSEHDYYLFGE